ncbi:MAG: hypothetical protein DWQ37_20560 [Planctomycetota bacterium]|nr:MAG: hypothetical protein DWQ37_20560 [Planctomycetota bacterium]
MFSRRLFHRSSRRARALVTAFAIVAYLFSVVGFPLPAAVKRDDSTPFPCQSHRCGCASASQCWQSCCCFTAEERLAWADEHGVAIPEDARAALVASVDDDRQPKTCCDEHNSHCDTVDPQHKCGHCASATPQDHEGRGVVWVDSIQARKCQGLSMLWVVTGASMPLEIPTLWEFDWLEIGRAVVTADRLSPLCYEPPTRPPRAQALSGRYSLTVGRRAARLALAL